MDENQFTIWSCLLFHVIFLEEIKSTVDVEASEY